MTEKDRLALKNLIPDLLPPGHTSMSTKRVRFILGQGAIVFDDKFAVEVYIPKNDFEEYIYFGIQRHQGRINDLKQSFRKLDVVHYNDPSLPVELKKQFEEAIFQFIPLSTAREIQMSASSLQSTPPQKTAAIHSYLPEQLSGAA